MREKQQGLQLNQKMYKHTAEVRKVVSNTDTALTALLSNKLIPDILITVGARLLTTLQDEKEESHIFGEKKNWIKQMVIPVKTF